LPQCGDRPECSVLILSGKYWHKIFRVSKRWVCLQAQIQANQTTIKLWQNSNRDETRQRNLICFPILSVSDIWSRAAPPRGAPRGGANPDELLYAEELRDLQATYPAPGHGAVMGGLFAVHFIHVMRVGSKTVGGGFRARPRGPFRTSVPGIRVPDRLHSHSATSFAGHCSSDIRAASPLAVAPRCPAARVATSSNW